jgi:hypothetical protein
MTEILAGSIACIVETRVCPERKVSYSLAGAEAHRI